MPLSLAAYLNKIYFNTHKYMIVCDGSRVLHVQWHLQERLGHSMGGFGAIVLARNYPDIYIIAYAMSGGFVSFTDEIVSNNPYVKKIVLAKTYNELLATESRVAIGMLTVSQAFSPNVNKPPFYVDKPFKMQGNRVVPNPVAYRKWRNNEW